MSQIEREKTIALIAHGADAQIASLLAENAPIAPNVTAVVPIIPAESL